MRQKSRKAREQSKNLYISTACYSDNTNLMLKELRERIDMSPNKAIKESFWQLTDSPFEWMNDLIRKQQKAYERRVLDRMLYSVPKYTITPDGCKCEWSIDDTVRLYCENDCLATLEALNYFNTINKTNNEKEKEKMDAKRCDRCGRLYIETNESIKAYLCGRVTEGEKKTYTPEKVKEYNTFPLDVIFHTDSRKLDMCPDCWEKLKNFFESGENETKVIKKEE